jgi:hypothetical protein
LRGVRALRGASLLELLLTLALGAVVLTAGARLLLTIRRLWADEREALALRHAARTTVALLTAELRAVSPSGGDLLRTSDTAVTLRAHRGIYRVCAAPLPGSAELVISRAGPAPRAPVALQESVLVFLADSSRDRWLRAHIGAVGSAACADTSPGWRLTLSPARSELDSVMPGSPLRTFETLTYRLYDDGAGAWWLGVKVWQGSGWAATSPIAGPLLPRYGLELAYLDLTGDPAAADTLVRQIRIAARVRGAFVQRSEGRRRGPFLDSLFATVAPRNQ